MGGGVHPIAYVRAAHGHAAPINGGHCYRIDRDLDQQARQQISLELGHNRIDVVSAYIGGRA